ncbi:ATP-binding protein [Streptomyces verrucosisporus]|uniref:ATP-binding protein n=1 Tax=Streptomyces verrucosisporus TaxID=1695161 RepID=UPI0019D27181|nr:ATP-binding protein [Streptomyces verrucosisporus]MBN3928243.1 ATP-binding protein [Streptomyces verrucosisporus]
MTGGRPPSPGGLWLASPVLAAACAALAAIFVTAPARAAVAWCGAAATLAVAAAAHEVVRRGREITAAHQRAERQLADLEHYCLEVMPPVVEAVQRGEVPGDVLPPSLHPADSDPRLVTAHEKLTSTVVRAVQDREFQRDSARRAIVAIACRIQAEIHRLQADLRRMQFKHPAPETLGDLMHLEHGVNVAGRVATSLAVLGGGSPARQWQKPVSLYDVLRAGSAPIAEYLRIELHRIAEIAVLGPAVEPLSLVFSELMDNATRYSPPSTKVVVNTEEVASGIEVSIEDKGVGLTEETRRHAEFLLTQAQNGLDLEDLGETARMGLRVAGVLAGRLGLRISLRPSTCDGVRAVVFVPHDLLTALPMEAYARVGGRPPGPVTRRRAMAGPPPAPAHPAARPPAARSAAGADADGGPAAVERNANGLPQRRRSAAVPTTGAGGTGTLGGRYGVFGAPGAEAAGRSPLLTHPGTGLWTGAFFAGPDGAEPDGDKPGCAEPGGSTAPPQPPTPPAPRRAPDRPAAGDDS